MEEDELELYPCRRCHWRFNCAFRSETCEYFYPSDPDEELDYIEKAETDFVQNDFGNGYIITDENGNYFDGK